MSTIPPERNEQLIGPVSPSAREPSHPTPLPVRGRGKTEGDLQGHTPDYATGDDAEQRDIPGAESPSPAHRERGRGEGFSPEPGSGEDSEGRKRRILLSLLALQIILIV